MADRLDIPFYALNFEEEFGRIMAELIARRDTPKAFSAFNLRELVGPKTGT